MNTHETITDRYTVMLPAVSSLGMSRIYPGVLTFHAPRMLKPLSWEGATHAAHSQVGIH